jgi:hypothetical protein
MRAIKEKMIFILLLLKVKSPLIRTKEFIAYAIGFDVRRSSYSLPGVSLSLEKQVLSSSEERINFLPFSEKS